MKEKKNLNNFMNYFILTRTLRNKLPSDNYVSWVQKNSPKFL